MLLILCLSAVAPAAAAAAAAPVEVLALFEGRAVVRTAAAQHMLREGETSDDGVTLLEATPRSARLRYRGEVHELEVSRRVSSTFRPAARRQVSISPDDHGQYRVRGAINGRYVNFLVDTGASVVALSQRDARSLDIDYAGGEVGAVQTAQGTARSHFVTLDEVSVGGLTAHNVRAAVIEGSFPVEILLGMSFLRQVSMQERGGVLTLSTRE
ncbi:MAG: TIGR02281 family clan AA aspartic protease [bacterium]